MLDTNVVVAGLRSPTGASAALIDGALTREFTLLLSVALALEYEAVCRDPSQRIVSGLSDAGLPASLKAAVAEISEEEGTSINQFVTTAVAEKISAMKTAEFFAARSAKGDIEAARRLLRRDGGQPPGSHDRLP